MMAAPLVYCAFAPQKTAKAQPRLMAAAAGGALLMWGTMVLGDAAVREYRHLRDPDAERGRSRWVQWLAGALNFAAGAIFIFRD